MVFGDSVVTLPKSGDKLELYADVSRDGLGEVLIQEIEDKSRSVIGFCSRVTTDPEKTKATVTE